MLQVYHCLEKGLHYIYVTAVQKSLFENSHVIGEWVCKNGNIGILCKRIKTLYIATKRKKEEKEEKDKEKER